MMRILSLVVTVALLPLPVAMAVDQNEFFEVKVRPVLIESCFQCHGGEKTSSGLRVDRREHLMEGGERGAAIIPGDGENSLLVQSLRRTHVDVAMPPSKSLPDNVINDIATWIDQGALWPEATSSRDHESAEAGSNRHWAFRPLRPVAVPETNDPSVRHPIDRFIRAEQQRRGLRAVAKADRRTLIRRASFDLTGLPPSWDQTQQFLEDSHPRAFMNLVDQLLASPHYGERWGRHWLDLARYADTAGDNSDYPIPQAHLYRDYVIDALNHDKPYDEFIREQIAGDILAGRGPAERYAERVIATGFLAQAKRFGTGDLEGMHLIIEDTLDTIGKVVLGLGLRCARCHDHKYDPITMEDYYGLYGFFQSTSYPFPGGESVKEQRYFVPTAPPSHLAQQDEAYFAQRAEEIDRLKQAIAAGNDADANQAALDKIEAQAPSRLAPVAYAVTEGKIGDARVQKGGNPYRKGETVARRFPEFLCKDQQLEIPSETSGRLQLANWLTDPANPLTARVMANRIWQFHFGKPLVPTPSNFGLQGASPTHPELLDWLAAEFINSGWSLKAMHRLIMSSDTYQMAAAHDASNQAVDSGNEFFWRFDRRRLDAESIRDAMLLLGRSLDIRRPGAHPFPSKDQWKWTAHRQFKAVYPSNHRSVYLMVQRLHPHPFLSIFNGPNTSATTEMRDSSTVPLQALFMSNSALVMDQASGFASSLIKEEPDAERRIERAFQEAFLRLPNERERDRTMRFLAQYEQALSNEGVPAEQHTREAWTAFAHALLTANEFLFVD
jgi:hypothetical protein